MESARTPSFVAAPSRSGAALFVHRSSLCLPEHSCHKLYSKAALVVISQGLVRGSQHVKAADKTVCCPNANSVN